MKGLAGAVPLGFAKSGRLAVCLPVLKRHAVKQRVASLLDSSPFHILSPTPTTSSREAFTIDSNMSLTEQLELAEAFEQRRQMIPLRGRPPQVVSWPKFPGHAVS